MAPTRCDFPESLMEQAQSNADAKDSIDGQQIIFESRKKARETARTQLSEQIAQLEFADRRLECAARARARRS